MDGVGRLLNMKEKKGTAKHIAGGPETLKDSKARPLHKTSFYLDLKDYHGVISLTKDIEFLGGAVETFLSKDVKFVVTNRPNWKPHQHDSSVDSSLSSNFTPNSINKSGISPYPLESSSDKNSAKTVNSRASALLEKARMSISKGSSDVLQIARLWGVRVVSVVTFLNWIKKLKLQTDTEQAKGNISMQNASKLKTKSSRTKTKLVSPFLKFEDIVRQYRPIYKQFREWPILNMKAVHCQSPFMTIKELEKIGKKSNISDGKFSSTELVSEGNHCQESKLSGSSTCKRLTTTKKVPGLKPGYCEMCCCRYENILKHIRTTSHTRFLEEPGFYSKLDQKIASLPDIKILAKTYTKSFSSSHLHSNIYSNAVQTSLGKESCSTQNLGTYLKDLSEKGKRKFITESDGLCNQKFVSPNQASNVKQPLKKRPRTQVQNDQLLEMNCVNVADENTSSAISKRYIENNLQGSVAKHYNLKVNGKSSKNSKRMLTDENKCEFIDNSCKKILQSPNRSKVLLKRKVLEPKNFNTDSTTEIASNCIVKPQCDTYTVTKVVHDKPANCSSSSISVSVGTRLLRSTALRRLSSQNHLGEVCSSPTILVQPKSGMTKSRKIKSSPALTTTAEIGNRSFKACRSLNLVDEDRTIPDKSFNEKPTAPPCLSIENVDSDLETGISLNAVDNNSAFVKITEMNDKINSDANLEAGICLNAVDNNSAIVRITEMNDKIAKEVFVSASSSRANDCTSEVIDPARHHQFVPIMDDTTVHANTSFPNAQLGLMKRGERGESDNENFKFDTSLDLTTMAEDGVVMAEFKTMKAVPDAVETFDECKEHTLDINEANEPISKSTSDKSSEFGNLHNSTDFLSNFASDNEDEDKFDQAVDAYFTNKIALLESESQEHARQSAFNTKLPLGPITVANITKTSATACVKSVPKYILRRIKSHDTTQWTVHVLEAQ